MEQFEIHGLSFSYPDAAKQTLSDVSLTIKKGEYVLLCGNSGCGKTTFVSGLLTALKRREKDLRAFKCGPDYIDPMFHASALGVPCHTYFLHLSFLKLQN